MDGSSKVTINCGPCEYENVATEAAKWCSECAEGYCDECLRPHKAAKLSRHHHLVSISEYQIVDQLAVPQVCQVHQKVFEYFCKAHDSVICIECVQSEHSKCPDLLSLQNAAKGAKTSTALNELEQNIDNLLENIENGIKMQDKNLNSILDSDNNIKTAVKTKHEEIIQYFERLQEKTLIELTDKYRKCQQEISSTKSTFIKKQTQLRNMKDRILQMKKFLSDVQAFVGMKMMTGSLNNEKEVVHSLVTDMPSFILKFEQNLKIQTCIVNLDEYGTTNGGASFVEPKVDQAQFKITSVDSIDRIQLQLRTGIDLKCTPCVITSCLILPNNQVMILNHIKERLMIYNENGSHSRDIAVPGKPFDATIIDRRAVAVTFRFKNFISIVNIQSNQIERNIKNAVKKWCWGISHCNRKLYVVSYSEGITVLDLYGRIIKKIQVDVEDVYNILTISENVIYTDMLGNIFSLDTNGTQIWKYSSSKVQNNTSAGITADERDNVYVVGGQSNSLIAVSKDGMRQKVLLTEQDGLKDPEAVYYSKEHKILLICNKENGHAALYDVHL